MSYASVAALNISPNSPQPQPDSALLNTSPPEAPGIIDDTTKVNLVAQSFRDSPRTFTSMANESLGEEDDNPPSDPKRQGRDRRLREAKAEGAYLWDAFKQCLLRQEVAGGCVGLLNLGLLGGLGRTLYMKPSLRRDTHFILSTAAAVLGLLVVEGYAAENCRRTRTSRGQNETRKAKKEGVLLLKQMKEIVFRPGVLGGFVGLANTIFIGGLSYISYTTWNTSRWDRRSILGIAGGILVLFSGEGLLVDHYYSR